MRPLTVLCIVLAGVLALAIAVPTCFVADYAGEAVAVARHEFSPTEMLKRYSWFKDAAAALDAKSATIGRIRSECKLLEGTPRSDWAREDRQQWNVWQSELTGTIGSYNLLAADYNAAMAKFNYAFTNVGDLPKGATVLLPREFKPYQEQ